MNRLYIMTPAGKPLWSVDINHPEPYDDSNKDTLSVLIQVRRAITKDIVHLNGVIAMETDA